MIVRCKKCNNEFYPTKGLISYCSLKCKNSREWSEEDKLKKSNSAKLSNKVKLSNQTRILTKEVIESSNKKRKEFWDSKLLNEEYESLSLSRLKKRIILEKGYFCNICNISEWNNNSITLDLDHIDGDNKNNQIKNLRLLCPNCHSQTDTYKGRNIKKDKKIDKKLLLDLLIENNFNFHKSLLEIGVAPKGGNYKICHKLKKIYEDNL